MRQNLSRVVARVVAPILIVLMTSSFVHLVASYWHYFRMGTSGANGMAVFYVLIPVALVCFTATAMLCHRRNVRHNAGWKSELLRTVVALTFAYGMLFSIEVARTADYPTENGEPVSTVAFLRYYVSGRG